MMLKNKNKPSGDAEIEKNVSASHVDHSTFFGEDFIETEQCPNEIHCISNSDEFLIEAPDDVTLPALPDLLDDDIQEAAKDLLWTPKRIPRSLKLKTEEQSFRNLSEEGMYVSKMPKVFYRNVLEQRLLSLDDKKWFGCDGHIKMLKVPPSSNFFRPEKSHSFALQTHYELPKGEENIENVRSNTCTSNILEINVINIKFEHHPLFSAEHIFERRLISLYDSYREKCLRKDAERTDKKLEALRRNRCSHNSSEDNKIYVSEVKKLREALFMEAMEYRNNMKLMLQTWKIIKTMREENGYSTTSVKLTIHKENCDFEGENRLWGESIDHVTSEIKTEKQNEYENELAAYREEVKQWKANEISSKPKRPHGNICDEEIKAQVVKQFRQSFKPPGEPVLKFSISYDNETSANVDDENETLRRKAIQTTKIYAKITCDGIEACKSKSTPLNNTFSCFIDETFALQLGKIPSGMCLEIHEQSSTRMRRKIGEVPLQIPDAAAKTYCKEKIVEDAFEKDELIHYGHEGVGSGQDVLKIVEKYTTAYGDPNFFTRGSVRYFINWLIEDNKRDAESKPSKSDHVDVNTLDKWAKNLKVDVENPKNAILSEYISDCGISSPSTHSTSQKYFSCNAGLQALMPYEPPVVEGNARFKVLQLRNNNEFEFMTTMVANSTKEILSSGKILKVSESYARESDSDKTVQEQRAFGKMCLKKIYTKIFQQCKNVENTLEYEDVVDEKPISYFENSLKILIRKFLDWFMIRANIKETPKKTNVVVSEKSIAKSAASTNVVIDIISATNVSQKTKSQLDETIQTFIEVNYQHVVFRTGVAKGINPSWKEQLTFQLRSSNTNYQCPDSLNDFITVNLFEECADVSSGVKSTNWLGYIRVPLSAIYYSGKIEGFFRVVSPVVNLYEGSTDRAQDTFTNFANASVLCVFLKIRIEPTPPKLAVSMAELPSGEPSYIWNYILKWNEKHNARFPHRKFSPFAIDVNGRTVCLTRFIAPLEPPKIIDSDFNVTPEQLIRYISSIPFSCTNELYHHVCLTVKQMLDFTLGSTVDHAIGLTCYFLAINLDAKLLLGCGLPNDPTAYVSVRELQDNVAVYVIYDVVTATKYNITDPYCPLRRVFAAVNGRNIWANVQDADELILTRFDVANKSDWQPLFNDEMIGPPNTVQEKITYTSADDVKELEFQIEKKIRTTIAKLRKTKRTLWNYNVSGILKDMLIKSEYNYYLGKQDVSAYTQSIQSTHTINGYIIDLPYVSSSLICDFIKFSKIYQVQAPELEYVSAVHIHSYHNNVFVAWIFIGHVICKQ